MPREILEQLFDPPVKVRLLKFFLRNSDQTFDLKKIVKRIKCDVSACRRQINRLESIKLINSKVKKGKKVYSVNPNFDFYTELRTLVLKSSPASKKKIVQRLRGLGRINLAVLSGIFLNTENARVDLLVVGENIKKTKLSAFLRDLEAEVGKEIDYVVLTTEDFKYRYDMFDRFIRDVFEKPHEKLINRLKV